MAWLDNYRVASYRGVEFRVESHDSKFGRRQVTHEYPQRDKPYTEDLGRRAREYTVDAYLVGDDYAAVRDRLVSACEESGPGELVHPYLGNMQVECTGLTLRETSSDGRMCRMQMTFVEAGEAAFPGIGSDPVRNITSAANDLMEASANGFAERFTVSGFASFVLDGASAKVRAFSALLDGIPIGPTGPAQDVARFVSDVRALGNKALDLVQRPQQLARSILGIVAGVRGVFGDRAGDVLAIVRTASTVQRQANLTTPNRRQEAANTSALDALIRVATTAELAKVAAVRASDSAIAANAGDNRDDPALYRSRDDAIAERDAITDALDQEAEEPETDALTYVALSKLRAEVVSGVPSPGLRLPSMASVTPQATLPSLVVAYGFYADAGRATEVARRNKAPHPGFLTGGQPLEVVADA